MLVISDSSPLNFLVRMGMVELLPKLFGRVLVPPEVIQELTHPDSPPMVREFAAAPPEWLLTQSPQRVLGNPLLDAGEAAAIALALELHAEVVLIDDLDARRFAVRSGLIVIGVLGVLVRADAAGLIALNEAVTRLPVDYRIDPKVIELTLRKVEHAKRTRKQDPG